MSPPPPPTKALLALFCFVGFLGWLLYDYNMHFSFWQKQQKTALTRQATWCTSNEVMEAQNTHSACAEIAQTLRVPPFQYAISAVAFRFSAESLLYFLGNNILSLVALVLVLVLLALIYYPIQYLFAAIDGYAAPLIPTHQKKKN